MRSCGRTNFTLFFCQVMSMLDPHTVNMFHFTGPKYTTPNCPVDMAPNFNPSSGAQSYHRSTKDCSDNSYYNIPFFLDRPGPKYEEWSVNAHEARPGHHTQVEPRLHLNTSLMIYFMQISHPGLAHQDVNDCFLVCRVRSQFWYSTPFCNRRDFVFTLT